MTDITAAELADMEQRARGWLPLQGNRDLAINEESMALDVLDLIDAVRKLAAERDAMRGVVEAAGKWRDAEEMDLMTQSDEMIARVDALITALDSYRAKVQR